MKIKTYKGPKRTEKLYGVIDSNDGKITYDENFALYFHKKDAEDEAREWYENTGEEYVVAKVTVRY